MDAKLLADALVTTLAPALPFLVSGGKELVEEAGKALNVELVKKLWGKLRPRVEEKPVAAEAAQEVARAPEDGDALGALRIQLRKILESDPALAAELAGLAEAGGTRITYQGQVQGAGTLVQGSGNVAAGAGGIAAGRDVVGKG
jgi:hypothetical protein